MKNVTMLPIDPRLIGVPVGAIPVPARHRRCLTAGAATASMAFVAVEDVGAAELAGDLEIVSRSSGSLNTGISALPRFCPREEN